MISLQQSEFFKLFIYQFVSIGQNHKKEEFYLTSNLVQRIHNILNELSFEMEEKLSQLKSIYLMNKSKWILSEPSKSRKVELNFEKSQSLELVQSLKVHLMRILDRFNKFILSII